MNDRPTKGMKYLHMGPWPGFVALCFDEKVFQREMKRLKVRQKVEWLASPRAAASLHEFVTDTGNVVWILTLGPTKGRSKEMVAGLIAHEAMHLIQNMQEEFAGGKSLGREAEAYLIQMVVQETLQTLWKSNRVRAKIPGS